MGIDQNIFAEVDSYLEIKTDATALATPHNANQL